MIKKRNFLLYRDENLIKDISFNNVNHYETILVSENESIDTTNLIKRKWNSADKVVSINNNEIMVTIKYDGSWRTFTSIDIEMIYAKQDKNYKIGFESINNKDEEFDAMISKGELTYSNSHDSKKLMSKINWVLSDGFLNDVKEIFLKNGFLFYSSKKIDDISGELFTKFKNKLSKNEELSGIDYTSFKQKDGKLEIKTTHGKFVITENSKSEILVESILSSDSESYEVINFERAFISNIKRNICIHTYKNVNVPMQIAKVVFGISLFSLLLVLTFTFIFDPSNISYFFSSFTSQSTWKMPWMYLIFGCFISSYIVTIFMGMLIDKYTLKRDRLEFKRAMHYFVAGSLRGAATFFTGNLFIAMFAWTWYLNRKLEIRTSSLVKVYSLTSIIRVFVVAIFGLIFMLWGTISYYTMYNPASTPLTIGVIVSSWIGFFWQLIHSSAIYFLLVSAFITTLFLNSIFRIKFILSKYTTNGINNLYYSKEQYHKGKLNLNWKDSRNIFLIFTVWTLAMIFIEGFDTIFHFNYIEENLCIKYGLGFKAYENPISIISLRYMSLQIHHIPIINILPGRGLFFSELGLKVLYEPVFTNHHGGSFEYFPNYNSEDMAEIVSFSTRFFGMYMKNIISMIIAMGAITLALVNKK